MRKSTFWPLFDPFLIPQWGISEGGLGPNGASKWPRTASKRAQNACLSTPTPEWSRVLLENHVLGLFFDPLSVPKWATGRPVGATKGPFNGPKQGQNSPKMGPGSFWESLNFGRFRSHFGPILGPFGAVFVAVSGPHQTRPFTGEKQANTRPKGSPHVARVDSVPRYGHRTPSGVCPCPGAVAPRLGPLRGQRTPTPLTGNDAQDTGKRHSTRCPGGFRPKFRRYL